MLDGLSVSHDDMAARCGDLPDVLVEGRGALDGRLVHLLVQPDIVGGAIADDCSLVGASSGVAVAGVLHNIIFYEGAGSPAVQR